MGHEYKRRTVREESAGGVEYVAHTHTHTHTHTQRQPQETYKILFEAVEGREDLREYRRGELVQNILYTSVEFSQ
jgi:hypothetical protein